MTLDLFGVPISAAPEGVPALDRQAYNELCGRRWSGWALRNARANWLDFERLKPRLWAALMVFHRNPDLEDLAGTRHNPTGTLTSFLWGLQRTMQADRCDLAPLLDFEEHFQVVFLRRGLVIYSSLLLRVMEGAGNGQGADPLPP